MYNNRLIAPTTKEGRCVDNMTSCLLRCYKSNKYCVCLRKSINELEGCQLTPVPATFGAVV